MRTTTAASICGGVVILAAAFAGCGVTTVDAISLVDASASEENPGFGPVGGDGSGLDGGDGGFVRSNDGTQAGYCAGHGPPVLSLGDAGAVDTCDLGKKTFRYALCTCEGYVSGSKLTTDGFDSTAGAYDAAKATVGGSVGTNGNFSSSGPVDVGGSLWASSASGMTLGAASRARAELHSAGNTSTGPSFAVGGNAWVASDWNANGSVTVGGTLTMPPGKTLTAPAKSLGGQVSAAVTVGPACECDPAQLLDVGALVTAARANNDDDAMGIAPTALDGVTTAKTLKVPCGRLYLSRIATSAPLTIELTGRTGIFVDGDVALGGDFHVVVPSGAELDLFIGGNVVATGAFQLGSAAAPAQARAYVAGSGTVNLAQTATLAGNVYAPRGEAVLPAGATVYGSIFARRVAAQGDLTIHFDESIVTGGQTCAAAATCRTCSDCGGEACLGGQCGSCTDSSQCCAPLTCSGGRCVPSLR